MGKGDSSSVNPKKPQLQVRSLTLTRKETTHEAIS